MAKKYWFRNKTYGWGWYPASIEGWICMIVFGVALTLSVLVSSQVTNTEEEFTLVLLASTFIEVIILLAICYKTGEPLRWRWGKDT